MSTSKAAGYAFSLPYALLEVARGAGYSIDGDDLNAALGLPFMVCAAPEADDDLGVWATYGRDAFLTKVGRLFGLGIRDVHPPEAACGLSRFEAFRQHFDASYRPLIARALEHDQPVLAWRGWAGAYEPAWGIIRRLTDRAMGVAGVVITSRDASADIEELDLDHPAVQLYVVETVIPARPSDDELLRVALENARSVLRGTPGPPFGVTMGVAAYDAWLARLSELDDTDAGRDDIVAGHGALAVAVVAGHESGIRFLQRRLKHVAPEMRALIAMLTASGHKIITALSMSLDLEALRVSLSSPGGRTRLRAQLTDAREAAAEMLDTLKSNLRQGA